MVRSISIPQLIQYLVLYPNTAFNHTPAWIPYAQSRIKLKILNWKAILWKTETTIQTVTTKSETWLRGNSIFLRKEPRIILIPSCTTPKYAYMYFTSSKLLTKFVWPGCQRLRTKMGDWTFSQVQKLWSRRRQRIYHGCPLLATERCLGCSLLGKHRLSGSVESTSLPGEGIFRPHYSYRPDLPRKKSGGLWSVWLAGTIYEWHVNFGGICLDTTNSSWCYY